MAITSTRSVHRLRARKTRKARVERSAQWMSSSTSANGCSRPSWSSSVSSASNSCGWPCVPPPPLRRLAAELRQQRGELGAHAVGQLAEHGVVVARERAEDADDRGVGQLLLAQLDALADRDARAAPRPRASSATRRDLPTPDSPATKASDGRPSAASRSAASSSASSAARPISRLLVIRVATPGVSTRCAARPGAGTGYATRTRGKRSRGRRTRARWGEISSTRAWRRSTRSAVAANGSAIARPPPAGRRRGACRRSRPPASGRSVAARCRGGRDERATARPPPRRGGGRGARRWTRRGASAPGAPRGPWRQPPGDRRAARRRRRSPGVCMVLPLRSV